MFAAREAEQFVSGLDRPEQVQTETLLQTIVAPNAGSEFGRAHSFDKIKTIDDYRRAVPVANFDAFRPAIKRIAAGEENILTTERVQRFFLTSGSTAEPKYVPVTASFVRQKSRAFGVYWTLALDQHPGVDRATIVTNFSDAGDTNKVTSAGGLPMSSESAYWSQVTAATQRRSKPIIPKEVARIPDADARYYAIAKVLLQEEFSGIMTLNPSTLLLLFQKMGRHAEELIADIAQVNSARAEALKRILRADEPRLLAKDAWPNLKLVVCWRSPMLAPYMRLLDPHLEGVGQRDYISMASEGVMSIPIEPTLSGGALAVSVHFYEFIPEDQAEKSDPQTILPEEAEVGKKYVVVLSNQAGLYRYNIGDVVRVARFSGRTPVTEFLHRTGNTCSLTGEKLTEDQVSGAVGALAEKHGLDIVSFTATPAPDGFPRYVLLLELRKTVPVETLEAARAAFDRELDKRNIEYGSKRSSERLGPPDLWIVAPGSYETRRKKRVASGTNDPQYKETHLSRDANFHQQFTIVEHVP